MRVYYLSEPLTASELADVEKLMDCSIEQVRVACLLPAGEVVDGIERNHRAHEAPLAPLKAAGIQRDYGRPTGLVAFSPHHWTTKYADVIGRLTGRWPYLIQTPTSRAEIGNPGDLRVVDLDGAVRS
jgi:hypothetical protein